jgi:hypothetical protein
MIRIHANNAKKILYSVDIKIKYDVHYTANSDVLFSIS